AAGIQSERETSPFCTRARRSILVTMHATETAPRLDPILSAPAILTRVIVYGTLAAFIALVYLVLPVGLGILLDSGPNPALSVAATAVVALAFARVRTGAERIAQRLVYGSRSTPYE